MSDLTLPTWTARIDWSEPLTETLEWSTSVVASNSGAEQRRSLRLSPRRTLETNVLVMDQERARVDLAVMAGGAVAWNVPLYYDQNKLTVAGELGHDMVYVNTIDTEFAVGGLIYFRGKDAYSYEVRKIIAMTDVSLTLDSALLSAWPKKTRVYPMKAMQFATQPSVTKYADRAATFAVNWQVVDTNDYPEAEFTEFHEGYPVFRARPDESGNLTMQYARLLDVLDNSYAIPKQVDMMGFAVTAQQYSWFLYGRAQAAQFRRLLYALRGRVTPVWIPTFYDDMQLAEPIVNGDTSITIKKIGISGLFSTLPPGRRDIILDPRGGGPAIYRRITSVVDIGGGLEVINVSDPFTTVVFPSDLKRISFMSLSRLSQDSVPITHNTDNTGLTVCTVIFQSTPENRSATDYVYTRFPNNTKTADPCVCGSECGRYADTRFASGIPYDDSITYTTDVDTTKAAYYDFLIAKGESPESADNDLLQFQSYLDSASAQAVADQRATFDSVATPEQRAALDPLSDEDFPAAYIKWYAYYLYYVFVKAAPGTDPWSAAKVTADMVDACNPDVLATFCASVLDQRVTKDHITVDTGSGTVNVPFPDGGSQTQQGFGIDGFTSSGWATDAYPNMRYPTLTPPGSTAPNWNTIQESTIQIQMGLAPSGWPSTEGHLLPGCGAVPLHIADSHYQSSLHFESGLDGPNPSSAYSWILWNNQFDCWMLSKSAWPATVKIRQRNSNGGTVAEWVMRNVSFPVPGTDLFINLITNYTHTSLRYVGDAGSTDPMGGYMDDPDKGVFKYLPTAGDYTFDILSVVSGDPAPESETVSYFEAA
jgi:hypothetical protein